MQLLQGPQNFNRRALRSWSVGEVSSSAVQQNPFAHSALPRTHTYSHSLSFFNFRRPSPNLHTLRYVLAVFWISPFLTPHHSFHLFASVPTIFLPPLKNLFHQSCLLLLHLAPFQFDFYTLPTSVLGSSGHLFVKFSNNLRKSLIRSAFRIKKKFIYHEEAVKAPTTCDKTRHDWAFDSIQHSYSAHTTLHCS